MRTIKKWSNPEIEYLRMNYGKKPYAVLSAEMCRTKDSIEHKAICIGLTSPRVAVKKYCLDCGKKLCISASNNNKTVRCVECSKKRQVGRNAGNWRGGVSKLGSLVHSYLYPIWILPILKRDGYVCQVCGTHNYLHVHHIRKYITIRDDVISSHSEQDISSFEERAKLARMIADEHQLSDGITLCKTCHKQVHMYQRGELLGTPEKDNQKPSRSNVLEIVDRKAQRLIGEDAQSNKPDTSAPLPHTAEDIV